MVDGVTNKVAGFLLTATHEGFRKGSARMREMLDVFSLTSCSIQRNNLSHEPMTLHPVGLDIVRPLPQALSQKKFILVATNYFSEWLEAKSYPNIKDSNTI